MKLFFKYLNLNHYIPFLFILFTTTVILSGFSEIYAQEGDPCKERLSRADSNYTYGHWEEAIKLIKECLAEKNIPESEKGDAFRLLGLVYIAQELEKDANEAIKNLVIMVPNYKIDPKNDPPQLQRLIDDVSQQLIPAIKNITPDNADVESEGMVVTVNGSDFAYGSKVYFNGTEKVTTYVNQNQLTAEISSSDLLKAGDYQITVLSPIQGGKTSNAMNFTVNETGSFPWTWVAIGGGAVVAAVAAVLALGGSSNDTTPNGGTLPAPPGRP